MFQQGRKTHAILTSLEALAARRAVAAAAAADKSSLEAFMSLRKMKPEQSNWKRLQSMLFSAGLSVCPTSGTPVMDIESCSKELQDASWAVLTALQKAINSKKKEINSKETVKLDEALNQLSFMISDPLLPLLHLLLLPTLHLLQLLLLLQLSMLHILLLLPLNLLLLQPLLRKDVSVAMMFLEAQ